MSDWKEITLGEICQIGDGAHAKVERQKSGIPYLTSKNFDQGRLKLDKVDFISQKDYEKLFSKKSKAVTRPQKNDILMGIIGTFGNAYKYKEYDHFGISSSIAILRPDIHKIYPDFLECLINSNIFKTKHKAYSSGSVQGYSNIPTIKTIPVLLPPLEEQRAIASTLSCLDAKIENLRKQNETLEAIAQTLFKHWFIDFEFPNEDGKPYKSSGGKVRSTELGEIPKDWRIGKLGEIIEVNPKESIKKGDIVKYIDMKALSTTSMEIVSYIKREFTSGSKFRNKDVLMARITPCLENGKTAFVNILNKNEVAFGSTEFIVLRAKSTCCPHYVYCLTRSPNFRDYAVKNMTGTSGRQRVPNDMIASYKLAIGEVQLINKFQDCCTSLFEKVKANQKQIQTLTKTRDELLPKLMSGQLRVKG